MLDGKLDRRHQMTRLPTACVGIASLLAWALFSPTASAASATECPLTQLATVKTDILPDGRITIPVAVGNHPLSFIVDTGGISTTIKWEQAKQLGLPVKQTTQKLTGVAGSMLNFYVTDDDFSVGALHVKDLPIYIETRALAVSDGTIGLDLLQSYDVDIDFAQGNLSLISQDHCWGRMADWATTSSARIPINITRDGHIRFPVKIDGKSIMAILDTGSATSLISGKAAAQLGIDLQAPELTLIRDTGQYQIYAYPFHSLDFGQVSLPNPHIVIASDNFIKELGSDLVLGIDALRQMHLYIAYREKKVYVTAAHIN